MKRPRIQAPASLFLDPALTPSAKLVWLIMQRHARDGVMNRAALQTHAGLSRQTIRRSLAELAGAGWTPPRTGADLPLVDHPWVSMPDSLLDDQRLEGRAKVMYGVLQLTPGFQGQSGQFTYPGLSALAQISPNTAKLAVSDLVAAEWLRVSQANRLAPVRFLLTSPEASRGEAAVAGARQRLDEAPFRGEALMREYLSLIVASEDFEDNAAPGFLVNPWTDERMQLDRFYPPAVALEFNGPQHYGATDRFSDADAARQRGRDYMKTGICVTRGIELIVIHPEDLTLETMRQKVNGRLPLRDLTGHQPLVDFLEGVSRRYRRAARRGRWR